MTNLEAEVVRLDDKIDSATAVAIALGGNAFLPNKKFNVTMNFGSYGGESAIAGQIGVLVSDSFAINAGVATGFGDEADTGFRVGGSFGW